MRAQFETFLQNLPQVQNLSSEPVAGLEIEG